MVGGLFAQRLQSVVQIDSKTEQCIGKQVLKMSKSFAFVVVGNKGSLIKWKEL
jgi:hypothetical protein